jgi:Uma2 family endonuclease
MIVALPFPATFDDLMKVEGKAELIGGRIVEIMPTGELPGTVAFNIAFDLRTFLKARPLGRAYTDNVGYCQIPPLASGRQSFAPDVSFYDGPLPANRMNFITGTPKFAVEVRSENDYGPAQDRAYAAKRVDYFEAGTLVVWDVDPLAQTVTKYTPEGSTVFALGDMADAEPAVPGWTVAVADVFSDD